MAYSGTLELTKIRKAGLNVRLKLQGFFGAYKVSPEAFPPSPDDSPQAFAMLLLTSVRRTRA